MDDEFAPFQFRSLYGLEHDWLAVDRDHSVGLFCTAGTGLAPAALAVDPDGYRAAVHELLLLPSSLAGVAVSADRDFCRFAALRGVYVFDAADGEYALVAAPPDRRGVTDFPDRVQRWACWCFFPDLRFSDGPAIGPTQLALMRAGQDPRDRAGPDRR